MIDELLKMLLDGRVIKALNDGYDAVIGVLIDLADGWLKTVCPAYALASDGAEALAPDKAKALKIMALSTVLHELGIDSVIQALIQQWLAAPSTVREAALLYASAGQDFKAVLSDPNLYNIVDLIANRLPDAYKFTSHIVSGVLSGDLQITSTSKWTLGFADTANSQVSKLLRKWKLGAVADAVDKYGGTVNHITTESIMIPANAVEESWKHITSGDVSGILQDVLGVSAISAVGKTIAAVGSDVLEVGKDVVKGTVSAGKTAARVTTAVATLGLSELF